MARYLTGQFSQLCVIIVTRKLEYLCYILCSISVLYLCVIFLVRAVITWLQWSRIYAQLLISLLTQDSFSNFISVQKNQYSNHVFVFKKCRSTIFRAVRSINEVICPVTMSMLTTFVTGLGMVFADTLCFLQVHWFHRWNSLGIFRH